MLKLQSDECVDRNLHIERLTCDIRPVPVRDAPTRHFVPTNSVIPVARVLSYSSVPLTDPPGMETGCIVLPTGRA
jgi:hypothetical protein